MRIALVAGEASGDLLGAGLIRAIRDKLPDTLFEGIAGPAMIDAGCVRLEDADVLAVMGLIEPLRRIPQLLRLRRSLVRRWRASPPDVFVGIDAPEFNFGLEKALRKSGIRTAHYVSPSIWAWRAGRVKTIRKAVDRILCILPFEKSIYDEHGIDAVFVGHPKADNLTMDIDTISARRVLNIEGHVVVAVLPGSRSSEVSRLGPLFASAAAIIAATRPAIDDYETLTRLRRCPFKVGRPFQCYRLGKVCGLGDRLILLKRCRRARRSATPRRQSIYVAGDMAP